MEFLEILFGGAFGFLVIAGLIWVVVLFWRIHWLLGLLALFFFF